MDTNNFDTLIDELSALYDSYKAGDVDANAFSAATDTLVSDIIASYTQAGANLASTSLADLEVLLLQMQAEGNFDPAGTSDIDVSLNQLVSGLSLDGLSVAPLPTPTAPEGEDNYEMIVVKDLDGDGVISEAEAAVRHVATEGDTDIIGVIDLNKDGVIDAADLGDDSIQVRNINPNTLVGDDGDIKIGTLDLAAFNSYNDDVQLDLVYDANGDGHVDAGDLVQITRKAVDPTTPDSDVSTNLQTLLETYNDYIDGDVTMDEKLDIFKDEIAEILKAVPLSEDDMLLLDAIVAKIVADGHELDAGNDFTDLLTMLVDGTGADAGNDGIDFYQAVVELVVTYEGFKDGSISKEDTLSTFAEQIKDILVIHAVDPEIMDAGDLSFLSKLVDSITSDPNADTDLVTLLQDLDSVLASNDDDSSDDSDASDDSSDDSDDSDDN